MGKGPEFSGMTTRSSSAVRDGTAKRYLAPENDAKGDGMEGGGERVGGVYLREPW